MIFLPLAKVSLLNRVEFFHHFGCFQGERYYQNSQQTGVDRSGRGQDVGTELCTCLRRSRCNRRKNDPFRRSRDRKTVPRSRLVHKRRPDQGRRDAQDIGQRIRRSRSDDNQRVPSGRGASGLCG